MLAELCAYLHNWFDIDEYHNKLPGWEGTFSIENGKIDLTGKILEDQMFRIYGSMMNDGVYIYSPELKLKDENFTGLIQSMRTEPDFIAVASEMEEWLAKYGTVNSNAMSPFTSESFDGYRYSKSSGRAGESGTGSEVSPLSVFGTRLSRWKKV